MHAEERHQAILRRLREQGSLRVTEFAEELRVSPVTVRRDIEALAERGLIARVHGGAVLQESHAQSTGPAQPARKRPEGGAMTFGLIVPAADYYYPEVIKGAQEAAGDRGIRLVLGISQYSPEQERAHAAQMLADGVDGLLITPCGSAAAASWLAELAVPHVLVERRPGDDISGAERVVTDHVYGARLAVRHLADAGYRRIGLMLREDSPHGALLLEGYRGGLVSAGLEPPGGDESALFRLPPPAGDAAERERLLDALADAAGEGLLDATLIHNDHDAIVLLQRLRSRGLDVPGDIAVVAYDDEVASLADIPLTAIAPPKHAVGAAAVDLLAQRVADPGRARHLLAILPELRVRASSAPTSP
ncbi:LacI family DNA-binding transcriptional regulator [Streptomyces fulvorobeus]|uniref:DNA-binding LacI/PurR family transcriptional regulator n=1 Tax=Streptomyces fulvorobeus TaxID=284028 RepID=A0A7J0C052_9ACTN|nr:substrate-binding domain-containing protein [Streptomyces fulvorobeus]NYE39633.1 DNA-binding LacI/PurR family transcriptional regulator [Streptomyces fulvorobeus]GFM95875.1 LacI family transcriptional regulator [Streptomyces fulvorobeus]